MRAEGVRGVSARPVPRDGQGRGGTLTLAPRPTSWTGTSAPKRRMALVADIHYVRTGAGWLYVPVGVDAWSRRIVGWAIEAHLRAELVEQPLVTPVGHRGSGTVIHHSGPGPETAGPWPSVNGARKST